LSVAWLQWPVERSARKEGPQAMRGKGLWLSIKSIFAPTEVAASLVLIVLVIGFAMVYFGARRASPHPTRPTSVAVFDASPSPDATPSPSPEPSPVTQPATLNGLGSVIRAAITTTRRPGPTGTTPPGSPSASPSPTDAPTPTPSPTDIPTPTPSPTDLPTPTPVPTVTDSPSPSPS
jgi:hypothetical protein